MEVENIFVYGTLKTGQKRESNWPVRPLQIRSAWTLGWLFDTGPFPALVREKDHKYLPPNEVGQPEDCVAGQLWTFAKADIPRTLKVLDQIEGTNQPGFENEYDREVRQVRLHDDQTFEASMYIYAKLDMLPLFNYLQPTIRFGDRRLSIWPKDCIWSA